MTTSQKKMHAHTLILIAATLAAYYAEAGPIFGTPLDSEGIMDISWRYTSSLEENPRIRFRFCVRNRRRQRLLGVAFSAKEDTTDADLIMFVMNESLRGWDLFQGYTTASGEINLWNETQSDVDFIPNALAGRNCVTFERNAITCRPFPAYSIDHGTTRIFGFRLPYSLEQQEPIVKLEQLKPALNRVQVLKSPFIKDASMKPERVNGHLRLPTHKEDLVMFDMTVDEVVVPDVETTYWCKVKKLPAFLQKMHIVRYESVITKLSSGLVHHMEVFHCKNSGYRSLPNYDSPCNSEAKPAGLEQCRRVIGAWAMGATALDMPPEAGIPLDPNDRYVVIEVHYNNPARRSGIIDSSGIRFYATSELRQYDSAIMELGLAYTPLNSIPPGARDFRAIGFCDASCTAKALPENGIYVFASQLHTHATGTRVATKHLDRRGQVLASLNEDRHYSPHFQEIRLLPRQVHVKPGDSLITECWHDTSRHNRTVFGGISISDEMCLNYIFYYPASELELCKSQLAEFDLERLLKGTFRVDPALNDVREMFDAVHWTSDKIQKLQTLYIEGFIQMSCNNSDAQNIKGSEIIVRPPLIPPDDLTFTEASNCAT